MLLVVECVAKNILIIRLDRNTIPIDGGVGLHEALYSDRKARRIAIWKVELRSVRLYVSVGDVTILHPTYPTYFAYPPV